MRNVGTATSGDGTARQHWRRGRGDSNEETSPMRMKIHLLTPVMLGGALLAAAAGPAAASYSVQTVTDPTGTNFINLLGINDSGTIGGFDNAATAQGFTLTLPNNFTAQNFPGSTSSMVTAINNNGDTAGIYTDAAGNTHGYTDIHGVFSTVDNHASAVFNQALGINNADTTVGYYAPTQAGNFGQIAYSQSHGGFTNINALLPANVNSQAVGINDHGAIVGFFQPTSLTSIGFFDKNGTFTQIDPFGSTFTQALGVNNLGEIVGFYTDANSVQHGYIDNNGVFSTFDPAGSVSTTINGVNNHGQIVGFYTNNNDQVVGFVGAPVPEPAAPIAVALAGLMLARLRFRRRAACAV
jgi:hypothetical protein